MQRHTGPFRILSISYDPNLLTIRHHILEQRGYAVESAEGFVKALQKCTAGNFDLLIMGHSIPHEDKQALLEATKQSCQAPVIAMLRANEPELPDAIASVDPLDPRALIDEVEKIAKQAA